MEAAESILKAGYRLDRYELLCPIATGGMATVWLARLRGKRGFEKLYAIKTIRTELVDDATFQEMFLDEARLASRIQHPHVAQILDLGEQETVLFIVMEWVDGDSLAKIRKVLSKRKSVLPVGVTLRVLADACAGLHAAHELRDENGEPLDLVHRDVSPQNILVSTVGAAKVIDFGIAKAHGRKQGETRTGVVKGKIQYLAPEQVKKGAKVDRRTDIWALGVCLQELVVGKAPYGDDDDVEVIRKLMSDEMPPVVEGIPEPIQKVLDRCLGFDPDVRFPTAAGLQRALEAAMKELGESTTTEDVAAFLRTECPELSTSRKNIVGKAIDAAKSRPAPDSSSKEEVAFAPTLVGETGAISQRSPEHRDSNLGTVALTKRKGEAGHVVQPATHASLELDEEPIVIPKRSIWWLWILLLLGACVGVGAYRYPDVGHRVLAMVGIGGGSDQGNDQAGAGAATAAGSVTETASATAMASATATASAATTASATAATDSAAASASAAPSSSHGVPAPSGHHHTWPAGASSATEEPGPEPVNSNWSLYRNGQPAPPPPPPAPKPSGTDSNPSNPY
jgi:eukaryotic-like serine/threonine-protein kinase